MLGEMPAEECIVLVPKYADGELIEIGDIVSIRDDHAREDGPQAMVVEIDESRHVFQERLNIPIKIRLVVLQTARTRAKFPAWMLKLRNRPAKVYPEFPPAA
jgi:hypothetical protein